jgi:membrane protein required for colicin V production
MIDLVFLVILLWAAYKGFSKGLIIQAASLAALLLGVFGAIKFSGYTAFVLTKKLNVTGDYLQLIAFAVTFVIIVIAVHIVARITEKMVKAVALDFVNRILGLFFSTIKIAFIISIILVIINTIDYRINFMPKDKLNKSLLYKPLSALAPMIFPYFRLEYEKIKRDKQTIDEIIV